MHKKIGLFLIVGLAVIGVIFAVYVANGTKPIEDSDASTVSDQIPLVGFNTQLRLHGRSYLNTDNFKKTVDKIIDQKLKNPVIRFSVDMGDIFVRTDLNSKEIVCTKQLSINCSYAKLEDYKNSLIYAKKKGVKVLLVTNVPYIARLYTPVPENEKSWSVQYSENDYLDITNSIYTILSRE